MNPEARYTLLTTRLCQYVVQQLDNFVHQSCLSNSRKTTLVSNSLIFLGKSCATYKLKELTRMKIPFRANRLMAPPGGRKCSD